MRPVRARCDRRAIVSLVRCDYIIIGGIPNMSDTNQAAGGAGGGNFTREELECEELEADRQWDLGCLGRALHKARRAAGGVPSWPLLSISDRRAKMHNF